jgi:hypothetical protein
MRARTLIGALLILAGGYVIARGVSYTSSKNVVDVGGLRISAEERHPVPTWVGGIAAIAGLVLVFAGSTGNRR